MAESAKIIRGEIEIPKKYERPLVMVIDMQNDLVHPEGYFAKHGIDISRHMAIVKNIKKLVEYARKKKIPIIHLKIAFRKDLVGAGLITELRPVYRDGCLREGTWGAEIIDELAPKEDEIVIRKYRYSGFYGTNLDMVLHYLKPDVIFFTGVATNSCVEATAKDAFQRDYHVVLVRDCTATINDEFQRMAEKAIEFGYGLVLTLDQMLKLF